MLEESKDPGSDYDGRMAFDPRRIEVIDEATAAVLRRMSPQERIIRGLAMGEFARKVISAALRNQHPEWGDEQVRREVARRFAGER